jgi:hypothetical protein
LQLVAKSPSGYDVFPLCAGGALLLFANLVTTAGMIRLACAFFTFPSNIAATIEASIVALVYLQGLFFGGSK